MRSLLLPLAIVAASAALPSQAQLVFEGKDGPGKGKHVVLLAGDEEYRSEESLPMLAKLLSERHGFKCTVSFSLGEGGVIDPTKGESGAGVEALDTADVAILGLRFRHWPDEVMKHFDDYRKAGKPFLALRTSTHPFNFAKDSTYAHYTWNAGADSKWPGGFGEQVLGDSWISHWGKHKFEATRGVLTDTGKADPLMRGIDALFGDTDVYEADPPADAKVLARGQVLSGMKSSDTPATYVKKTKAGTEQPVNDPAQAVVWSREVKSETGNTSHVVCTTLGSATDLKDESMRRLVVNATYSLAGLEVPAKANVEIVGEYNPTFYGFNEFKKGVMPASLK
jgi:hypothetical protein